MNYQHFFNIVIQSILCCIHIKRYGFLVHLICNRWGNNTHVLQTFIWAVLLLVHNKIFGWMFNVFPSHYIDEFFFTARTCGNWITLPCWRVHGTGMVEVFPQLRTKPISLITSLVVTVIQPIHGMLLFYQSQYHPKTDWHAARWQTGGINTVQAVKSGLNRNLQRGRSTKLK